MHDNSSTTHNVNMIKTPPRTISDIGTGIGLKAGVVSSSIYALVGILIVEMLGQGIGLFSLEFDGSLPWSEIVGLIFIGVITIAVLAIAPAMLLGGITGTCLALLVRITRRHISKYSFVLLSCIWCLAIVVLLHILFQIPIVLSFQVPPSNYSMGVYETYLFLIGIPSLVYILAGGWIGWAIYSRVSVIDGI